MNTTIISNLSRRVFALVLLTMMIGSVPIHAQSYSGNPILSGYKADPSIFLDQASGKYYIYPTSSGGNAFNAYSSTDLTNWVDEGPIFDLDTDCSWSSSYPWAPDMISRNGQYYFYYSAGKNVGVAVGSSPTGPFTDLGYPLITNDPGVGSEIDPHPFIDDDGQAYLYYGGSGSTATMGIRKLNQDMVSFSGSPTYVTLPYYVEAPYMIKRNGTYYLMYSTGNWQGWAYKVEYATASSPLGPFSYQGRMLYSVQTGLPDAISEHGGPGHHSVLKMPGCDEYYVVYHRYEQKGPDRRTAIDRMYFNSDGTIKRVQMTNNGVLARRLNDGCRVGTLPAITEGTYRLKNVGANKYLTAWKQSDGNSSWDDQDQAVVWNSKTWNSQKWAVESVGTGQFRLKNIEADKYLTAWKQSDGNSSWNSQDWTVVWSSQTWSSQKWVIESAGNGQYWIKNVDAKRYLTGWKQSDGNSSWDDQDQAVVWSSQSWSSQKWLLEPVSNARTVTVEKQITPEEVSPKAESGLGLYPNPATYQLQVVLPASKKSTRLLIQDLQGRTVLQKRLKTSQSIEVGSLPKGMYLVRLQQGTHQYTKKLLLE